MPRTPARVCAEPGCPEISANARCDIHHTVQRRQWRNADRTKVYNSKRWKMLRRQVLTEQPTCQHQGCTAQATDVDHITPMRDNGAPYDRNNLQALCHPHHSAKTGREIR